MCFGCSQRGVVGEFGEVFGRKSFVVHAAAVVVEAVGDDEVVGAQHAVVGLYLVENLLRDGYVGRLVFHNEAGTAAVAVVEYAVAAAGGAAYVEAHLVGQQGGGVAFVLDEVVDEVLPHPFFGGQSHIAAAQEVEDGGSAGA